MNFDFLDKDGTKQFKNVLNYLINPNLITNSSQRTKISRKGFRKETIVNSFKNLTAEDKKMLIKEMLEIENKEKTKIVNEMIEAFADFQLLDEKESIADFLYVLMKNIYDKEHKLEIFNLIYLNHPSHALKIIYETESEDFKKELCQLCILSNPERGYIYSLLNNIEVDTFDKLNLKKLVNEINFIQSFSEDLILKRISMNYKDLKSIINEINNRIKDQEFQTFCTLAKNIELLNSNKFNVNKKEIELLKWAIDITDDVKDNDFMRKANKKDLESYSTPWLIFISLNFLQMDYPKQKLSIMILNYLLDREDLIEEHSYKIAEEISLCIKEHEKVRDNLLSILGELKTTRGFYNIMDLVEKEGFNLIKNKSFKTYISQGISYTREFKWLSSLGKSKKYKQSSTDLDPKALTFALIEKPPKENYELLNLLKEHDKDLYLQIMKNIEDIITNNLDEDRKYIMLIIALNYESRNEDVFNIVKKYEQENPGTIKSFIKVCDPNILEKYYIEQIKETIFKNENNIVDLLGEIEEPEIKSKCSYLVLEMLIEKDFDELINIWDNLTLDIESKIKFREKILKMINNKEIQLTKKNIAFINEMGIEPVILYNSIKEQSNKQYLLDIWYQSNEFGKITNMVREIMIDDARSLEDLKKICELLDNYNISDSGIDLLIKIKAYTMISIELLELDIVSESSINRLNEISNQLTSYGLIDRFLMDKFLQREIDKRIVDYLYKRFMDNVQSNELLQYYWDNIMEDIKGGQYNSNSEKIEIFLNHLTKSKKGIEWFLDIIDNANIEYDILINIIETLLILVNKQNRVILQNQQEIDQMEEEILTTVGKTISKALSNMERTIINRAEDRENDILIKNLKRFRKELNDVGIGTVEDIENYGKQVKFNSNIHENMQLTNLNEGVVDSLGVSINGKNILFSTLLEID